MPLSAVFLALAIGLIVGGTATFAMLRADRRDAPRDDFREPTVPEPAAEVLSILSSAFVVLDSAGDVLRASPLAYSYGLVRASGDDYPRLASKELVALAADVSRSGGARDARFTLRRAETDASDAVIDVRMGTLGQRGVLLLADDLTRAARVEATRRDFVANVSHELKTPVGALTLLAETMEDAAEDPDAVRRFAVRMQTESRRLSHLVQEIIELSRVQGYSSLPDAEAVNVDDIIAEAVTLNRTAAAAADIRITVGGTEDLQVFGSASMLTSALSNLIANAISYSDTRTAVGIATRRARGMVEISVKDEGIGISKENLERVFERFFRVDKARSRATGGTGLGLAIVKHIATDHGGEVTAWSMEGQGSTFIMRLPEMGRTDRDEPHELPAGDDAVTENAPAALAPAPRPRERTS